MSRVIQVALRWPANWPRATKHESANFSGDRSLSRSVRTLYDEVKRIKGVVPMTIAITCGDALAHRTGGDVGAAVYFTSASAGPLVLACDKWDNVAHNVWALACHVKAMRSLERWGVGTAKQTWRGFAQLPPSPDARPNTPPTDPPPPPPKKKTWRSVLGFAPGTFPTANEINIAYKNLMTQHHPDKGGNHQAAVEINEARDIAMMAIGEE